MSETSLKSKKTIPLSVPELTGREWDYVKECFETGWVSTAGPHVTRLETEFAKVVGAPYAVAMTSGTAALHVALTCLGLQPDEAVITADLTFVAPANAIRYCGAWPIFIDADPATWQMDVVKLRKFLSAECEVKEGVCIHKRSSRRVRAILPVHIMGLACDMSEILAVAQEFHLEVVEDAAEGLGVRLNDKQVGVFGDIGIFSFNGNKIITAGGGGMLVTRNEAFAKRARYLSTQAKDDELEYIHNEIGFNYRLNNMQAALGLSQLESLPDFIRKKKKIADRYAKAFSSIPGLTLMPEIAGVSATYWLYTILLPDNVSLDQRKGFIAGLNERGVGARPFWRPLHSLKPFKGAVAYEIAAAENLYHRGVSLPSSVGLTESDQQICIDAVCELFSQLKR